VVPIPLGFGWASRDHSRHLAAQEHEDDGGPNAGYEYNERAPAREIDVRRIVGFFANAASSSADVGQPRP